MNEQDTPAAITTATALPEPQVGGSYRRNADGSLTLTEQSQQVSEEAAPLAPAAVLAEKPAPEQPAVAIASAPTWASAPDTQAHQE